MEIVTEALNGIIVFKPKVFKDERGEFFESFNSKLFKELVGEDVVFVQDNQSLSNENVFRGLHFQAPPFEQGKLVRVISGAVIDVAVDIRKGSSTYGELFSAKLTSENKHVMWVPPGFAHGFYTLTEDTIFSYKCTNVYNKLSEGDILWSDKQFNLINEFKLPILSIKDQEAIPFAEFKSPF